MSLPESEELRKIVEGFTSATRKGTFQWKAVNPTTYVWEGQTSSGRPARLTLQRVVQRSEVNLSGLNLPFTNKYLILQVHEVANQGPPQLVLSLSGASDSDLNEKLEALYQLIVTGFTEKGLDFLKSIVPNEDKP